MSVKENNIQEIKPITMPGVHDRVYRHLNRFLNKQEHQTILDVGAGHGAFSKRLHDDGFTVSACDLNHDYFLFDTIEFRKADITSKLPYEDNSFDVVLIIEVMEHIHDHLTLFRECNRVLKKSGIMFFSTPNIISLKSRVRFLFTGFFYTFKPLDHSNNDGLQHISSLTIDQYSNLSVATGFSSFVISIDKKQQSSRWLSFLIPFIWISCRRKGIPFWLHNKYEHLTGRLLFFTLKK